MGIFSDVGSARGTRGGFYFGGIGQYRVKIIEAKQFKTRKQVEAVASEVEIIEVFSTDTPDKYRVGAKPSWMVTMDKDPSPGNVADFLRAAIPSLAAMTDKEYLNPEEESPEWLTEEDAEYMFGEENPLAGVELILETFDKTTQGGGTFTVHRWSVPNDILSECTNLPEHVKKAIGGAAA